MKGSPTPLAPAGAQQPTVAQVLHAAAQRAGSFEGGIDDNGHKACRAGQPRQGRWEGRQHQRPKRVEARGHPAAAPLPVQIHLPRTWRGRHAVAGRCRNVAGVVGGWWRWGRLGGRGRRRRRGLARRRGRLGAALAGAGRRGRGPGRRRPGGLSCCRRWGCRHRLLGDVGRWRPCDGGDDRRRSAAAAAVAPLRASLRRPGSHSDASADASQHKERDYSTGVQYPLALPALLPRVPSRAHFDARRIESAAGCVCCRWNAPHAATRGQPMRPACTLWRSRRRRWRSCRPAPVTCARSGMLEGDYIRCI